MFELSVTDGTSLPKRDLFRFYKIVLSPDDIQVSLWTEKHKFKPGTNEPYERKYTDERTIVVAWTEADQPGQIRELFKDEDSHTLYSIEKYCKYLSQNTLSLFATMGELARLPTELPAIKLDS